jgi:hypothetical protein
VRKKGSRRLVIDASVARSAGQTEHPVSRSCREFLDEVRKVCHNVVMTREIEREWTAHPPVFSSLWLGTMERRRKVAWVQRSENDTLRDDINRTGLGGADRHSVQGDVHLVEAALATDLTVISRDDAVRRLLSGISGNVGLLKKIVWVNPVSQATDAIAWLAQGAPAVKAWQLGSKRGFASQDS